MKPSEQKLGEGDFAFCESVAATGTSPWHIRRLTAKGLRLGGGADTESFCSRKMGWDLDVVITSHHLTHACQKCVEEYMKETSPCA